MAADAYPAAYKPPAAFTFGGINYMFPSRNGSSFDNIKVEGQTIPVPRSKYFSAHILAASSSNMAIGTLQLTYSDGTSGKSSVLVPPWWDWPYPTGGDLVFPHLLTNKAINYNRTNIFEVEVSLDSTKELTSIILPNTTSGSSTSPGGAAVASKLHIFSLSLVPVGETNLEKPQPRVQYARSTKKWVGKSPKTQLIEVIVNNLGSRPILRNHSVSVSIQSQGLTTVQPGYIKRLAPGDQVILEVGVINKDGVSNGTPGPATVVISGSGIDASNYTFNATLGIAPYEPTYESIFSHESPAWYNNVKYGIFIHWGVYAVPGWGNTGKNEGYAEW